MTDRRDNSMENRFASLLEAHITQEEEYKHSTTQSLAELQSSLTELTKSTQAVLDAYETAQQAIRLSIIFGKIIKFIIGLVIAYYTVLEFIHHAR